MCVSLPLAVAERTSLGLQLQDSESVPKADAEDDEVADREADRVDGVVLGVGLRDAEGVEALHDGLALVLRVGVAEVRVGDPLVREPEGLALGLREGLRVSDTVPEYVGVRLRLQGLPVAEVRVVEGLRVGLGLGVGVAGDRVVVADRVKDGDALPVHEAEGVLAVPVLLPVALLEALGLSLGLRLAVVVAEKVRVGTRERVRDGLGLMEETWEGLSEREAGLGLRVGLTVRVVRGERVWLGVGEGEGEGVAVGVAVTLRVSVALAEYVRVPAGVREWEPLRVRLRDRENERGAVPEEEALQVSERVALPEAVLVPVPVKLALRVPEGLPEGLQDGLWGRDVVRVPVPVPEGVGEGVGDRGRVPEWVGLREAVGVRVTLEVSDGSVAVPVARRLADRVRVGVTEGVGVWASEADGVREGLRVGVRWEDAVGVAVAEGVRPETLWHFEAEGEGDAVVGVGVAVGRLVVAVGDPLRLGVGVGDRVAVGLWEGPEGVGVREGLGVVAVREGGEAVAGHDAVRERVREGVAVALLVRDPEWVALGLRVGLGDGVNVAVAQGVRLLLPEPEGDRVRLRREAVGLRLPERLTVRVATKVQETLRDGVEGVGEREGLRVGERV